MGGKKSWQKYVCTPSFTDRCCSTCTHMYTLLVFMNEGQVVMIWNDANIATKKKKNPTLTEESFP